MDPLLVAARGGDYEAFTSLFATTQSPHEVRTDDGLSSTLLASRNGHLQILEFLLARGADPNDTEHYGGTCLMAAACYGHPECARALVRAGADVHYRYPADHTGVVYMMAYCFSHPSETDEAKEAKLLGANESRFVRTLALLLAHGARDSPIISGATALSKLLTWPCSSEGLERTREERAGMIALLQGAYWAAPSAPRLATATSPEEIAALVLAGAACEPATGRVSEARVRLIDPAARRGVRERLARRSAAHATFVGLVLPAACLEPPRGCEPLCVLGALTAPGEPLSLIADYAIYAGVPGARARRVSREVERILADLG